MTARPTFEQLIQHDLPSPRQDAWRHTPLAALQLERFMMPAAATTVPALSLPADVHALVFINGHYQAQYTSPQLQPYLQTIALNQDRDEANFCRRLNQTSPQAAWVIDIPAHIRLDKPLYLYLLQTGPGPHRLHPHIQFRLGPHSQMHLLTHIAAQESEHYLLNALIDIDLAEHAQLKYQSVQTAGTQAIHLNDTIIRCASNAQLETDMALFGGRLNRQTIHIHLAGERAQAEARLLKVGGPAHPQLENLITVEHHAPHCRSRVTSRGVFDQQALGQFQGKIIAHPHTSGTDAKLEDKNLLLSKQAQVNTNPLLEIYHDAVQCAHGTSVGELDPASLFYLANRGLDRHEAQRLLILGFLEAVKPPSSHHLLNHALEQGLQQQLEGSY